MSYDQNPRSLPPELEAAMKWCDKGGCDEDGILAEYAAKLRLAGENA